MASIWPIIILQFACQRRAPHGKLINQLWSIAYHVLFMQSIRPGPEITEPIRSEATRSESIRSEFYSIRYGVVLCLASVTCTSVIKRRLILIIFLKNLPSSCLASLRLCSARFGSVWFGSPRAEGNQATCSWVWLIYESSTFFFSLALGVIWFFISICNT